MLHAHVTINSYINKYCSSPVAILAFVFFFFRPIEVQSYAHTSDGNLSKGVAWATGGVRGSSREWKGAGARRNVRAARR